MPGFQAGFLHEAITTLRDGMASKLIVAYFSDEVSDETLAASKASALTLESTSTTLALVWDPL